MPRPGRHMGSNTFEELLDRAAALRGIEPGFWDIFGQYHPTTTAGKQAILRAMGWTVGSIAELEQSLAAHTRREWERLAPVTVVALEGETVELPLNLPGDSLRASVTLTVRLEGGATQACELHAGDLAQSGAIEMDGRTRVRVRRVCRSSCRWDITRLRFNADRQRPSRATSSRRAGPGANRIWRAAGAPRESPSASTDCALPATGAAAIFVTFSP